MDASSGWAKERGAAEGNRRYTVYLITPTVTWLVAVGLALGQWLTLLLCRIPPCRELQAIST